MSKNPFKIKGLAKEEDFFNREKELDELTRRAVGGQHTLLIAPRRYGKSSLLEQMASRLKQTDSATVITIDLFKCSNLNEWLSRLGSEILRSQTGPWNKIMTLLQKGLPKLAPKFSLSASGTPEFSFDLEERKLGLETLESLLTWFDHHPTKKRKVLILDEIQEILNFENAIAIEKTLRAVIQRLNHTTVFYSGSLPSLLKEMFHTKTRPFFRSALLMELGFAPIQEAQTYLEKKFSESGRTIPQELPRRLAEITQGHPYYTQLLGFFSWETYARTGNWNDVQADAVTLSVFTQERITFENEIAQLTQQQRAVFRAIIRSPDAQPTSKDFLMRHRLGAHASVRKAIHKLEALGFVLKAQTGYIAADPLLALWWKNP